MSDKKIRIPIRHNHELGKYGYEDVKHKKAPERHTALDKAVKEYGPISVERRLNALAIVTKNTHKTTSKLFERDRNYVHKKHSDTKLNPIKRA
jgi:hypothetical protein